jgi:hypothetical protein
MFSICRYHFFNCLIITAAGLLALCAGHANAAGALAIGLPSDVAKEGVAMFTHVGARTAEEAKAKALAGCKSIKGASDKSKALCKVVASFQNQCVAEALDPQNGTPGFGWALASSGAEAKKQAIANCRDTAGPARQDACIVDQEGLWCDGSARKK